MKNNTKNKSMTLTESLTDPALAELYAAVSSLPKMSFSKRFPKKHETTMLHVVEMETKDILKKRPNMPINKVITTIFKSATDDIDGALALKLTQKIVETWEKRSISITEKKEEMAIV